MLCVLGLSMLFAACTEPEEEPKALFSYSQKGTTVTFSNASHDAKSYVWDFGDNETSTEENPVHAYTKAGDYTVVLTATNVTKTNKYSQTITISQTELEPSAKFSYEANELTVAFKNASTNGQSYKWDFGDGKTTTDKNPTYTYSKSGTYKVTLTAINGAQSNNYAQDITVTEQTPKASFTYSKNNLSVSFINTSTNAKSYKWEFGDGKTSTDKNPNHTYTKEGNYTVKLTATNVTKSNTITQTITITSPTPTAKFTFKTEHPLKVVLTNTSSNATSYEWNFGDGKTSTEKNPTHRYDSGIGVYKIKLTAKNGSKSSTYEANVEIKAPTTCSITGFTINKIPTNNKYYQVQLTDDYILSKTTYFWTSWFLLSSANLPYSYNLTSAKTINITSEYVVRLYKYAGTGNPSNSQAGGKGDWNALISPSSLQKYPETLTYSNSSAEIKMFFSWK